MKDDRTLTLYFIKGAVPTAEDISESEELSGRVVFRNSSVVTESDSIEECDFVAGNVPESYSDIPTQDDEEEAEDPEADDEGGSVKPALSKVTKQPWDRQK